MNAKKARLIRQTMKKGMTDPQHTEYDRVTYHVKRFFDGAEMKSYNVVNPIRLDAFCGRSKYKDHKRNVSAQK